MDEPTAPDRDFLTTKELAELLRIRERKVYDLAAAGEVPCTRVVGKLLFPRREIETWLAEHGSGPRPRRARMQRPPVILGSHDPLLEWAIGQSGCGCSTLFGGSGDGLQRFAARKGIASGLHLRDPVSGEWNIAAVRAHFADQPVVLMEFAWRERGLLFRPDGGEDFSALEAITTRRLVTRQPGSGAQLLLETLVRDIGGDIDDLDTIALPAHGETEAGLAVLEGRGDVAIGLASTARQMRLGFRPLLEERFDLLVDRRDWFEPPFQSLFRFLRSSDFRRRAAALGGYRISGLGAILFNGA